jgi:hypothetical protein
MSTKTCTKCGLPKDENEFGWERPGHRHAACKPCRVDERMVSYEGNKEKELKYKWERQVAKREEACLYVFTYLTQHPCQECGESDPLVLTFHHVCGTKKNNVSQMVNQGYSLRAIQEEISKTIILCANCHMKEEKRKRGTNYSSV